MKKCPPGIICVENFSMLFFLFCGIIIIYLLYKLQQSQSSDKTIVVNNTNDPERAGWFSNYLSLNDVLLNPYSPPLRDERYLIPRQLTVSGAIPINVSTNVGAVDTNYRQIGILTSTNSLGKVIPLMGRPLFTNRNKWQYYTISDQNNSVKLPLSKAGKSCTNEYGCDKLDNGDTLYVEGFNEPYRTTIYDNDTMKYLPFV